MTEKIKRSWREDIVVILAGVVASKEFTNDANIFIIKNDTDNDVYVSNSPALNHERFEVNIPPKGQRLYQKPTPTSKLYFYSPLGSSVKISSFEGEFNQNSISQTTEIVTRADLTKVTIETMPNVTIGDGEPVEINMVQPLPAGTNNIGDVDIASMPNVVVSTLPALPAGNNNIGDVDIASMPSVVISTLPSLPAGANNIGVVDISSMPNVVVSTLPSLPAGANNIGDVDVVSAPTLEVKLDSIITLLTQIEINTRPVV